MRHVLSLSGRKDSAALAIYTRGRVEGIQYVFSGARKELPERYEYLEWNEGDSGIQVNPLNADLWGCLKERNPEPSMRQGPVIAHSKGMATLSHGATGSHSQVSSPPAESKRPRLTTHVEESKKGPAATISLLLRSTADA